MKNIISLICVILVAFLLLSILSAFSFSGSAPETKETETKANIIIVSPVTETETKIETESETESETEAETESETEAESMTYDVSQLNLVTKADTNGVSYYANDSMTAFKFGQDYFASYAADNDGQLSDVNVDLGSMILSAGTYDVSGFSNLDFDKISSRGCSFYLKIVEKDFNDNVIMSNTDTSNCATQTLTLSEDSEFIITLCISCIGDDMEMFMSPSEGTLDSSDYYSFRFYFNET